MEYSVRKLKADVYRITSEEHVYMDLLVGSKRALLIDTGYAYGDLKGTVERITRLPLTVVNTHGHPDHANGNWQFADCDIYMHEGDWKAYEKYNSISERFKAIGRARRAKFTWGSEETISILPPYFDDAFYIHQSGPALKLLKEGMRFDLGGKTLEVYETPGHTWGSCALLHVEEETLYIGDGANAHVLVCADGANVQIYRRTLMKLKALPFRWMITGHDADPLPKTVLDDYLECAMQLDLSKGCKIESPINEGEYEIMCFRRGYTMQDMQKDGFACIITDENHIY